MIPTSPFQLARMRHLDLLTLWFRLHPNGHDDRAGYMLARGTKDALAAAILRTPHP